MRDVLAEIAGALAALAMVAAACVMLSGCELSFIPASETASCWSVRTGIVTFECDGTAHACRAALEACITANKGEEPK